MNYYTLSGKNANTFFKLNLIEDKYYDWEYVKKMAITLMDSLFNMKDRDKIVENITKFQKIINERQNREIKIKELLSQNNIKFIKESYVIRRHIMYNKGSPQNVVHIMHMMKILFENCDIINKWENYKIKNNQQIYSYQEKDSFYKKTYDDFIKNNPKFKL